MKAIKKFLIVFAVNLFLGHSLCIGAGKGVLKNTLVESEDFAVGDMVELSFYLPKEEITEIYSFCSQFNIEQIKIVERIKCEVSEHNADLLAASVKGILISHQRPFEVEWNDYRNFISLDDKIEDRERSKEIEFIKLTAPKDFFWYWSMGGALACLLTGAMVYFIRRKYLRKKQERNERELIQQILDISQEYLFVKNCYEKRDFIEKRIERHNVENIKKYHEVLNLLAYVPERKLSMMSEHTQELRNIIHASIHSST